MQEIKVNGKELNIKFTMGVLAQTGMTKTQFTETIDKGGDVLFKAIQWMVYYGMPKMERPKDIKDIDFDKEDFYEMSDQSMVLLHAYAEFLPKKMGDAMIAGMENAVENAEQIVAEGDEGKN